MKKQISARKQIPMKLFISLTIILLTIPSLSFWLREGGENSILPQEPEIFDVGVEVPSKKPALLKGYEMGQYQKDLTAWFNNYFYFRNFSIRLKNSLFYLANFKRFFYLSGFKLLSYKNRIVGNAFQQSYYNRSGGNPMFDVEKIKKVQRELNRRGKKFLLISEYVSWDDAFGEKISPYYRYFDVYYKAPAIKILETCDSLLRRGGINYFNAYVLLKNNMDKTGIEPVSFYDNHWNRYGAGLAMIASLEYLKTQYKTDWGIPKIKSIEFSKTPRGPETVLLNRVRLFRSLTESFKSDDVRFPYIVYGGQRKTEQIKVALLGDSYLLAYTNEIKASNFIDEKNITTYFNEDEKDKKEIKRIIDENDVLIIIYGREFYSSRSANLINMIYDCLYPTVKK
jgi:hypothetical protein